MNIQTYNNNNKKVCSKCQREKPLSEFYRKGDRPDSICKSCKKEYRKTAYANNKFGKVNSNLLAKMATIVYPAEINRLKKYNRRLTELVEQCQKRENL